MSRGMREYCIAVECLVCVNDAIKGGGTNACRVSAHVGVDSATACVYHVPPSSLPKRPLLHLSIYIESELFCLSHVPPYPKCRCNRARYDKSFASVAVAV